MQTAEKIGGKIMEARKKMNLSQAQLARLLSVSPQAVGKWERGESMPDIVTFNRLAEVLGVDMNYFSDRFASDGPVPDNPGPDNLNPPAAARRPAGAPVERGSGPRWDMSMGNWVDSDFSGLKNLGDKFGSSNIKNCVFTGSELSGLTLKSNNVVGSDFSGSDMSGSRIKSSNIANCRFKGCDMSGAQFSSSQIKGCDFSSAVLAGTVFETSSVIGNAAEGAIWSGTAFKNSQLTDMVFTGGMEDCSFDNCAFTKVTFQNAVLVNTFFKCRSLKKLRFIDCNADNLTRAFLNSGKADMAGVSPLAAPVKPEGGDDDGAE